MAEPLSASRTALAAEVERERLREVEADRGYRQSLMKELEAMRLTKRQWRG